MDKFTKELYDKAAAYDKAAQELKIQGADESNIEFVECKENVVRKAVRAFAKTIGFSSKYQY